MRFPGFVGPSYKLRSVNVDAQRCINLYPEVNEMGRGKSAEVASLVGTPGLSLLVSLGNSPSRGLYTASNGILYAVAGNSLYKISSSWVATKLGELTTNVGQVSMADNGITLFCVDGSNGYEVTLATDAFVQTSDVDFQAADQVVFQDGYFIFNRANSNQFFFSGLNATTFDALDIIASEGNPDDIVGIISDHRDLYVFNENTTEVYYNAGSSQVFERTQGAFIEHGCASRWSIQKMNNKVFWLGRDDKGQGLVYMAQGLTPQRISTHAVENAISGYDLSTCVAYTYQQEGHNFYAINFTSANTTWVYDATTNLWHERTYLDNGQEERHLANTHAFAYGKNAVGDYRNGNIYAFDLDTYTDNGSEIVRRRVAPHISADEDRVFYKTFELDLETGVGADGGGQGSDPLAVLQFSDDGGSSWSNEKYAGFGKIGERKARCIWRRLGASRDRVFRVTISEPVKVAIIGAEIDIMKGNN